MVVGLGIAGGLLYLTFRNRPISDLIASMKEADLFWTLMGALGLFGVYFFRGLRWKIMLDSSDHPARSFNSVISVLICYLVNSATPRLGEVARCTVILRTDKVPIPASLGTVFTERVIDAMILFVGIGIIFLMEVQRLGDLFAQMSEKVFGNNTAAILIAAGVIMVGGMIGVFFFLRSQKARQGIMGKLHGFISTMVKAAQSIFRLENPWLFIFHTVMIWICLTVMNYFFLKALPSTNELGMYFALLILFIGGIGWALPAPGGMGTTHFIIYQLFLAFGLSGEAGQDIGAFSNGMTLIFTVFYGLIGWLLFMWVVNRQEKNKKNPNPSLNS